jgi:Zn-dependent metalloprotease
MEPTGKTQLIITFDEGGVHFNSGLQNYWYYLLTEGGNGTNDAPKSDKFKVTAIGQQSSETNCLQKFDELSRLKFGLQSS